MNILYISPLGCINPHLFPRFKKTFEANGHTETNNPNEATHCFINIQSGELVYNDEHLKVITQNNIPIICFDCREFGTMRNEKWSPSLMGYPLVHFIRNMNKKEKYPDNCYPFDWPYFEGCDYNPTTKEELFSREFDCAFIGCESPTRKKLIDGIIKHRRLKINLQYRDHTQRFSHYSQWVDEHRKAKLYISCDGGGYTNERPNQLFAIAPMLRNRSNHKPAFPFTDGINCVEINEEPTEDDIKKVLDVVNDKDWLYDIYINGIEHTKKYMSDEGVSNYVLEKIKPL